MIKSKVYMDENNTMTIELEYKFKPSVVMTKSHETGEWEVSDLRVNITYSNGFIFNMYNIHRTVADDMIENGKSWEAIRDELDEHEQFMEL